MKGQRINPLVGEEPKPNPYEEAVMNASTWEELAAARKLKPIAKHGDHDQSDHGNWARGISSRQVLEGLTTGTYAEGFTLHIPSGGGPKRRFVVAKEGFEKRIKSLSDVTVRDIQRYRRRHDAQLKDPATYLGGWVNDKGEVVLDVSIDFDDRDEAIQFGTDNHQDAIWDNEDFEVITL